MATWWSSASQQAPDGACRRDGANPLIVSMSRVSSPLFPGDPPWDGHTSIPLACGEGQDFPASDDPAAGKAALEASHCDPQAREPFIAALTLAAR